MHIAQLKSGISKLRIFFADISFAQVIGGALAAVTAAFILSKVGVAGTLVGAAAGSVIGSAGTAFYKNSIINSHKVVQKVAGNIVPISSAGTTTNTQTSSSADTAVIVLDSSNTDTAAIPVVNTQTDDQALTPGVPTVVTPVRTKMNWKVIGVSALVSLLAAVCALLLVERITQQPISSTHTITRVIEKQVPTPVPVIPTPAPSVSPTPNTGVPSQPGYEAPIEDLDTQPSPVAPAVPGAPTVPTAPPVQPAPVEPAPVPTAPAPEAPAPPAEPTQPPTNTNTDPSSGTGTGGSGTTPGTSAGPGTGGTGTATGTPSTTPGTGTATNPGNATSVTTVAQSK